MADILRINKTGQAFSSGSGLFCEKASLNHGSNATLLLFEGVSTDNNKKLVASLRCLANSSDQQDVYYNFKNGIYAEMTATGAGFGVGLLYRR